MAGPHITFKGSFQVRSSIELKAKRWITNCSLEYDAEREQFSRCLFDSESLLADAVTLDTFGCEG